MWRMMNTFKFNILRHRSAAKGLSESIGLLFWTLSQTIGILRMLKSFSMGCYPLYFVHFIHGRCDSDHTRIRNAVQYCEWTVRTNLLTILLKYSFHHRPSFIFWRLLFYYRSLLSLNSTFNGSHLTAAYRMFRYQSTQSTVDSTPFQFPLWLLP